MSLSTTIKTIQDIMRKDAGVDGDAQRVSQLGWMLFLKVLDDRDAEKELLDDDYNVVEEMTSTQDEEETGLQPMDLSD